MTPPKILPPIQANVRAEWDDWMDKEGQQKKSYVLGKVPFDEVYKGDCLTFRGQNASFPRYDNFFANFCQKVPHFEGL